jgi:hypothetical protein
MAVTANRPKIVSVSIPALILEIDVGERLSVVIAHHEECCLFFDGPGRREAADGAARYAA